MTRFTGITIAVICLKLIDFMKRLPKDEVGIATKKERIVALIFLVPITLGSTYLMLKYEFPHNLPFSTHILGKIFYSAVASSLLSFILEFFLVIGFRDKIAMG